MNLIVAVCNAVLNCRQWKISENGIAFTPGSVGATIQRFRLRSVQGDYLTCRTWDGTTLGSSDVFIAKNPKLRNSIVSEVIDGITYTYTYSDTTHRTATNTDDESAEDQTVVPAYIPGPESSDGDEIWAASAETGIVTEDDTPKPVKLIDLNLDARAWAKIYAAP